jgi:uncharacterized protein (TIGR00255 family)
MIKSMTGFGQGSADGESFKVRVDIRTVNNRFLDIHTRLPQEFGSLEIVLKKQIQSVLSRGRVDLTLYVDQRLEASMEINRPLVAGYLMALNRLRAEFGIEDEPSLDLIARLPGALQASQNSGTLDEALVAGVTSAVSQALAALIEMRRVEGQELAAELASRLDSIEKHLDTIEGESGRLPGIYRERLQKRLQELLSPGQIDDTRLAQEAALLAERSDISEEIVRLKSHIIQMKEAVSSDEEIGKRLDFMLQEMNREANTILSKSTDLSVTDAGIAIKSEVEKLREQAQNVE